jgi:lysophospholipase L1-like esterase
MKEGSMKNQQKAGTARVLSLTLAILFALASAVSSWPSIAQTQHWVATWGASPDSTGQAFGGQTIRQLARISIGGQEVRLRFSNEMGAQPVVIGAAHVAISQSGASIQAGTDRVVTFGGSMTVTIGAGAAVISDPVTLNAPALSTLAVSTFLPNNTGPASRHFIAQQTTFISPAGNFTNAATLPVASTSSSRFFLSAVYILASQQSVAIIAFGDSITDGVHSTSNADHRWPDDLAARLAAARLPAPVGVVNEGISGNRVLANGLGPSAESRFDRDVTSQPGAGFVILLEGINDIGVAGTAVNPTAQQITAGYQNLISRAHAHGLKIIGCTLTPFGNAAGYFSPQSEAKREAVNTFIRSSGAFDAVIDFDAAVKDPAHPMQFQPTFDSGDHLHPNDAGYQAMANAINLGLF